MTLRSVTGDHLVWSLQLPLQLQLQLLLLLRGPVGVGSGGQGVVVAVPLRSTLSSMTLRFGD